MHSRREFLITCGKVSAGALCGGFALLNEGCASYNYLKFEKNNKTLAVKKLNFIENKQGVVDYSGLPAPIYLSQLPDGGFAAVSMKCTHKGCEVSPAGRMLICPCHGSEFSNTGKVLQSPAERDLTRFGVKTDHEYIYILLES